MATEVHSGLLLEIAPNMCCLLTSHQSGATMFRISANPVAILALCAGHSAACSTPRNRPRALDAAAAMEKVLVDVIARSEKSVVAIARVRKEQPGETFQLEFRPDPFGRRPTPLAPPQPTDPDFIPNEYGTGVVVDRAA